MIPTRKSKFAAAVVAGTALLGGGTAAFAATRPNSPAAGTIHIFLNVNVKSPTTDPIVIAGAIGDYGTSTSITEAGKVDPNGNYDRIVLKKGTFEVNAKALNAKADKTAGTHNIATCSGTFATTGTVSLFDGTGLYKGISGTLEITESYVVVLGRLASGACNQNGNPLAAGGELYGAGKVTFS
jgi:hypothetical protein